MKILVFEKPEFYSNFFEHKTNIQLTYDLIPTLIYISIIRIFLK